MSNNIIMTLLLATLALPMQTLIAQESQQNAPKLLRHEWGAIYDTLGLDNPQKPVTVSGIVFCDTNENGKCDNGEDKLAGVCVSDGAQVVKTDTDGTFRMEKITPGLQRFVFVSIPTGFRIGGNFYQRIPVKTEDMRLEFSLTKDKKSNNPNHCFAHMTDLHGGGVKEIAEANAAKADFIVVTGDIVNDGSCTQEFVTMEKRFKEAKMPVIFVPGNHDLLASGCGAMVTRALLAQKRKEAPRKKEETDTNGRELYEDFFGPTYYSFNYGGRHYVCFNNVAELDRQREWLKRDLAALEKGTEILILQHYPPERVQMDFLAKHNVHAVFFGHTHTDMVTRRDGILLVNTAGPANRDLSPRTVRIVKFNGKNIELANHTPGYGDQTRLPPLPKIPKTKLPPVVKTRADWPQFKGDAGRTAAAQDSIGPPLALAWTKTLGGSTYLGSPVLAHGKLYIGIGDRENKDVAGVYALDPATGKILWRQKADSFPVITAGGKRIFFCEREAKVRAINADTGDPQWNYSLFDAAIFRQYSQPVYWDGLVIAGNGKHFAALSADTGGPVWHMPDSGAGIWPNFSAPVLGHGKVITLVPGVAIIALEAKSGKELWRVKDIPINTISPQTPAIRNGKIFHATRGQLYALDLNTGKSLWKVKVGANQASPAADTRSVYVAGNTAVIKLNADTGAEEWKSVELAAYQKKKNKRLYFSNRILAAPVVTGAYVHVATTDGELATLDAKSGKLLGVMELGRPFVASPAASGNTIFLSSYDGTIFAVTSAKP